MRLTSIHTDILQCPLHGHGPSQTYTRACIHTYIHTYIHTCLGGGGHGEEHASLCETVHVHVYARPENATYLSSSLYCLQGQGHDCCRENTYLKVISLWQTYLLGVCVCVCFWERIYIKQLTVCICVGNIHTGILWVGMFLRTIHISNSRVCVFLRPRTYGIYVCGTQTYLDNNEYVCLRETCIPRHSCVCIFLGNIHTSNWEPCETHRPRFLPDAMSPRNTHTRAFEVCTFGQYIHTYIHTYIHASSFLGIYFSPHIHTYHTYL